MSLSGEYTCDRCGANAPAEFQGAHMFGHNAKTPDGWRLFILGRDLCPGCVTAVKAFLRSGSDGEPEPLALSS